MLKNPRIIFAETMYGYTSESELKAGRDLTEKDFKKWYDHIIKTMPKNNSVDTYAVFDDDDEEGVWHDITASWFIHEMNMQMDAINGIPEELPFN